MNIWKLFSSKTEEEMILNDRNKLRDVLIIASKNSKQVEVDKIVADTFLDLKWFTRSNAGNLKYTRDIYKKGTVENFYTAIYSSNELIIDTCIDVVMSVKEIKKTFKDGILSNVVEELYYIQIFEALEIYELTEKIEKEKIKVQKEKAEQLVVDALTGKMKLTSQATQLRKQELEDKLNKIKEA